MDKKNAGYIGIVVLVVLLVLLQFRHKYKLMQIKRDQVITNAYIYNVLDVGSKNSRLSLHYKYEVQGVVLKSDNTISFKRKGSKNIFINRSFPVVYSKSKPEKCKLLISEEDFELFDIAFPDSMYWTVDYINW